MTTTIDNLTAVERAGINTYGILFAYDGMERTPLEGMSDEIHTAFVKLASDPRVQTASPVLGAPVLESAWGDRKANQDDPPVSGYLGRAIDIVIAELTPLAEARSLGFLKFVDSDWNA